MLYYLFRFLEQFRQHSVQLVALLDEQESEKLVILERGHQCFICFRKVNICIKGVCYNIRLVLARKLGGQNTNSRREIAVYFHKANSDKAVKPSVGYFLNHLLKSVHKARALRDCAALNLCRLFSAYIVEFEVVG